MFLQDIQAKKVLWKLLSLNVLQQLWTWIHTYLTIIWHSIWMPKGWLRRTVMQMVTLQVQPQEWTQHSLFMTQLQLTKTTSEVILHGVVPVLHSMIRIILSTETALLPTTLLLIWCLKTTELRAETLLVMPTLIIKYMVSKTSACMQLPVLTLQKVSKLQTLTVHLRWLSTLVLPVSRSRWSAICCSMPMHSTIMTSKINIRTTLISWQVMSGNTSGERKQAATYLIIQKQTVCILVRLTPTLDRIMMVMAKKKTTNIWPRTTSFHSLDVLIGIGCSAIILQLQSALMALHASKSIGLPSHLLLLHGV